MTSESQTKLTLYVVMSGNAPDADPAQVRQAWPQHEAYIQSLVAEGRFVLAGSFQGTLTGMTIFSADSREEAEAIAARDPMVAGGFWRAGRILPWNIVAGTDV